MAQARPPVSACRGAIIPPMDKELIELQARLLGDRPPPLGPDDGAHAYRQHAVVASAVLRAARLNRRGDDGDGRSFRKYIERFFPPTYRADAGILWHDWRCSILKTHGPGPRIAVTHGQPHLHLTRDNNQRLCIDLESMWADFETSVGAFIEHLQQDPERREVVLARVNSYRVEPFVGLGNSLAVGSVSAASFSQSATTIRWEPPPRSR